MLLHPPCNECQMGLEMRNAPVLPTGSLPVEHAVEMRIDLTIIPEFYQGLPDRADLLYPLVFPGIPGSCRSPAAPGALAVPVRPLGHFISGPSPAVAPCLDRLDGVLVNKGAEVFP